jgi:hypothetical protein
MISRFAKSLFIIILVVVSLPEFNLRRFLTGSNLQSQSILAMLAMLHPPSRAYIDPWTGQLFGEGGVEKTWHPSNAHEKGKTLSIAGVDGGVIMSKLGNETAK